MRFLSHARKSLGHFAQEPYARIDAAPGGLYSRYRVPVCMFLILTCGLSAFTGPSFAATGQVASPRESNSARSWALGIVLPQGSSLEGDGKLDWESVRNVTAVVQLPEIIRPDLPVYAVLSVMNQDKSVLQVAAGVYQQGTRWLAFANLVTNFEAGPPRYQQILNSSGPVMSSNGLVSISIFRSSPSQWSLRVVDASTGSITELAFPARLAPSLRAGDQEVFALESYSWNQTTFEDMGSLSLLALLTDGRNVSQEAYAYSDWDPAHSPLFVLGSPGTSPPLFISVDHGDTGPVVWHYASGQGSNALGFLGLNETILLLIMIAGTAVGLAFILEASVTPKRSGNAEPD